MCVCECMCASTRICAHPCMLHVCARADTLLHISQGASARMASPVMSALGGLGAVML